MYWPLPEKILQMHRHGELLAAGGKARMTGDHGKVCRGVVPLEHEEARDLAECAGLQHRVAEIGRMGEFRTLEHERVGIRRDEQIALAVVGDVRLAHGGADINNRLPDVVLAELGNVECRRPGDQHRGAVAVHLPGQRIPGAVETIRHEIVGYTGGVIAVDRSR